MKTENISDEEEFYDCSERYSAYAIAKELEKHNEFVVINGELNMYVDEYHYYKSVESGTADKVFRNLIPYEFRTHVNGGKIQEIIKWLNSSSKSINNKDLSKRKNYLNFIDGCINVQTMQKEDNPQDLYFQNYLDMEMPDFKKKKLDKKSVYYKMVEGMFGSKRKVIDSYEEILGLIISNIRDLKISPWFYGPSNTGKSVTLNMIKEIIGKDFSSFLSFSQLNDDFAICSLCGKVANFSGEISGISQKRVDVFKSLVGNDGVEMAKKYQDLREFVNSAMLVFACNNLPTIPSEEVEYVLERVVILPMLNPIPRSEWISDLNAKLSTKKEKEIIVTRAVWALNRFIHNGYSFSHEKLLAQYKNSLIKDCNSFLSFAKEYIKESDKKDFVFSSDLDRAYEQYCQEWDLEKLDSRKWSKELLRIYPSCKKKTQNNDCGKQNRGFSSISLLSDELSDQDTSFFTDLFRDIAWNNEDFEANSEEDDSMIVSVVHKNDKVVEA